MSKDFHEIPISCRGIAVVLLKKVFREYKVLLMKRATPILQDAWCYIGGGIEEGEITWEAALREIREETGITKVTLYSSNKFDQFYNSNIYIAPVFVGYVDDSEEVILNWEHKEFKWLTVNEAMQKTTLPVNDEVLKHIEKYFIKRQPAEWMQVGK